MHKKQKPLFRKVNTKAFGVHHVFGSKFKYTRNAKKESRAQVTGSMARKKERGLDYTPLFRFLLSKVGQDWDAVFAQAKARLDKTDPIYWMVAKTPSEKQDIVRTGATSFFSGLFVDEQNILQLVNPNVTPSLVKPMCTCCTYTLNGIPVTKKSNP